MKRIVVLLLVTLGIFCFGAITMAEDSGANFYLDYNFLNLDPVAQKINTLGLGVDYNKDVLALGANFQTALSYSPAQPGASDTTFFAYGGYNVVQGEGSLAIIGSYWNWTSNPGAFTTSSVGLGIRGAYNFDAGNISLLYSYGLSNSMTGFTGNNLHISVLEIKGVYYFTESVGMHVVYRSIPISVVNTITFSGIGIGVDFKF